MFIFGSYNNNKCYYLTKNDCIHFTNIPKNNDKKQKNVAYNECALFEMPKNNTNIIKHYALIYGGSDNRAYYQIFEILFENKENIKNNSNESNNFGKWNANVSQCNNVWFNNQQIMKDGSAIYGFGDGLSMVTDLFDKSIIHIAGGYQSRNKYGYFKMNEQCLNNNNHLSTFHFLFFFCLFVFTLYSV